MVSFFPCDIIYEIDYYQVAAKVFNKLTKQTGEDIMQGEMVQQDSSLKNSVIQDPFLNALRRQRVPVAIYLTNGIKLQGVIAGFDSFIILLKNNTKQMVYKRAIATVVPSRNIVWHDGESSSEGQHMIPEDQESIENY